MSKRASHVKGSKHNLKLTFQKESSVALLLNQNSTIETTAVVSASTQKEPSEGKLIFIFLDTIKAMDEVNDN